MKYTVPFKNISNINVKSFGGKAASLGEMVQAGLPVPEGFGISTSACKDFSGKKLSDKFEDELLSAFDKLKLERVAVRSSAVAEDAGGASWAGQLETYLNVTRSSLVSSVQKCWRSINAERVKNYAKDKHLNAGDLLVGVAVQAMIPSEVSGVMFTANPVTNDTKQIMIEAVYGLGEMIVQGIVTPDNFIVSKNSLSVEEFNINIKEKEMVFRGGRNRVIPVSEVRSDKATLKEVEVEELAELGLKIEKHYRKPMDIEWALYKGKFYILQARPITTLR